LDAGGSAFLAGCPPSIRSRNSKWSMRAIFDEPQNTTGSAPLKPHTTNLWCTWYPRPMLGTRFKTFGSCVRAGLPVTKMPVGFLNWYSAIPHGSSEIRS
jgi:hypothetical protein